MLEQTGFCVTRLAARVVWGQADASALRFPRTHMVLLVELDDARYLCDVGFGGITPTGPVLIETDEPQATPHETFRVLHSDGLFTLQALVSELWHDVYVFDLQAQSSVDYEMANHYVCTWPRSHFRYTLIAARAFDGGRIHLRNRLLTTFDNSGQREKRELHGAQRHDGRWLRHDSRGACAEGRYSPRHTDCRARRAGHADRSRRRRCFVGGQRAGSGRPGFRLGATLPLDRE